MASGNQGIPVPGKAGRTGYDRSMDAPPSAADVQEFLGQAIDLAVRNVADGGGPFGALVVTGTYSF